MSEVKILFSINEYDDEGDMYNPGVFLHFGIARVKVADDISGFREFVKRLEGMIPEMEGRA